MTEPALPGTRVDLPLPPEVTAAWGYPGKARYVVFYLDTDLDDVIYNDGQRSGNGATWAFRSYRRHCAVEPLLRPFNLNEDCLVIDTVGSRASVATGPEAADFLRQHRPPLPSGPPMTEQLASLVQQLQSGWEEVHVDPEAVRRAMAEQRGRVGRMIAWLDMAPVPPEQRGKP